MGIIRVQVSFVAIFLLSSVLISSPPSTQAFIDSWFRVIKDVVSGDSINPEHEKCFGNLGCIKFTQDWYSPLNFRIDQLPKDRTKIATKFLITNRTDPSLRTQVYITGLNHLLNQGFDASIPTKFIIHGFNSNTTNDWATKLITILHKAGDFNIFLIDWSHGAVLPYSRAIANALVVSLEVAHYINFLEEKLHVKLDDIHCIGHSLGAHICGYVGQRLEGHLGQITGLDPAGPGFYYESKQIRLDPSDAKFVDVVHSDGRTTLLQGFGMIEPCGHVDFYPNGGQENPRCKQDQVPESFFQYGLFKISKRAFKAFTCNHHQAIDFYIAAVNETGCKFIGHVCDDYKKYLNGKCGFCGNRGERCAEMGLNSKKYLMHDRSLVRFFFSTSTVNDDPSICVKHYLVKIQLAFPEGLADERIYGQVKITLNGTQSSLSEFPRNKEVDVTRNDAATLTFLVQHHNDIGDFKQVKIEWKSEADKIFSSIFYKAYCLLQLECNYKMFVKTVQVSNMDYVKTSKRSKSGLNYCFSHDQQSKFTAISSGSSAVFQLQRKC